MIESYSFGRIMIDGKEYTHDVIIFPDHINSGWWRLEGHKLQLADLREVLHAKPKTLVIGTGHDGVMEVQQEVRDLCRKNRIELIEAKTADAVKKYNKLSGPGVVGAFHLTC